MAISNDKDNNSDAHHRCNYCGATPTRLQRCSQCRKAWYCSVDCQRNDWTMDRHRSECRPFRKQSINQSATAHQAWNELQEILCTMIPQEAHIQMQKAQEQIYRIRLDEQQQEGRASIDSPHGGATKSTEQSTSLRESNDDGRISTMIGTRGPLFVDPNQLSTYESPKPVLSVRDVSDDWTYVVEEISNLACYQVTLRSPRNKAKGAIDLSNVQLTTELVDKTHETVVRLQHGAAQLFYAKIPARLKTSSSESSEDHQGCSILKDDDYLCIRLPTDQEPSYGDEPLPSLVPTAPEILSTLQCRFCEHPLFAGQNVLKRALPLPGGHWDEITDYLICYNGQPAVDFSSASVSAQPHCALENESVLILHRGDIESSISVLAVESFGDNTNSQEDVSDDIDDAVRDSAVFRGPRSWRDAVGGATACCSLCCSPLGFASVQLPETFRLLKHRLTASHNGMRCRLQSCASFVANEMVRYSESKAIYTFVVSIRNPTKHRDSSQCLLLKLLSWDSKMAFSGNSLHDENGVDVLEFLRVAKVVYEVSTEPQQHDMDPLQWTWGGIDLCCLPEGNTGVPEMNKAPIPNAGANACVRLWLSPEEWEELRNELINHSPPVSKAVVDATLMVKLGKERTAEFPLALGLSALPL